MGQCQMQQFLVLKLILDLRAKHLTVLFELVVHQRSLFNFLSSLQRLFLQTLYTIGLFKFRVDRTKDFFNGKRDAINLDYFDL